MQKFLHALPFELTTAQKKVIAEIQSDLAAKYPMNRLLQGDVGSGKTVVAIAAILLAVEAGYQAAFMAPTQVLAEQHYTVLRRWRCFGLRRDAAWPRQSCHRGARFLKTGRSADLLSQAIGSRTSALCCLSADRRERETRSKSGRGGVRTLARTFASIFLRIT